MAPSFNHEWRWQGGAWGAWAPAERFGHAGEVLRSHSANADAMELRSKQMPR